MNERQQKLRDKALAKNLARACKKLDRWGMHQDVDYAVEGMATEGRDTSGVLYVLTDGKVGFLGKNLGRIKDVALAVAAIETQEGMLVTKVDITLMDGKRFRVKNVAKWDARELVDRISNYPWA